MRRLGERLFKNSEEPLKGWGDKVYLKGRAGKLYRVLTTYLLTSLKYAYYDEDDNLVYNRKRVREELGITARQERYYLEKLRRRGYLKRLIVKRNGKIRVYYTYTPRAISFFESIREALKVLDYAESDN